MDIKLLPDMPCFLKNMEGEQGEGETNSLHLLESQIDLLHAVSVYL